MSFNLTSKLSLKFKNYAYKLLLKTNLINLLVDSNIADIKLKKRHNTALILGMGPSLSNLNKKIFDEVDVFAVNSYVDLIIEQDWPSPDFYFVQDLEIARNLSDKIINMTSDVVISSYISLKLPLLRTKASFTYHLDPLNHWYSTHDSQILSYKFSLNSLKRIYDGYTVISSIIETAIYMNYDQIILLGVDAYYSEKKSKRYIINPVKYDLSYRTAGRKIRFTIDYINDAFPGLLCNASSTSTLTFLPYVEKVNGKSICCY